MAILIQDGRARCRDRCKGPQLHSAACESSSWASSARCCSPPPGARGRRIAGRRRHAAAAAAPRCAQLGGWQRLADKINAPVYCPSWLPDPLVPQIGNRWNNINSVDADRSYLESWAWQEAAGLNTQEIHVNLRGYPGQTAIPKTCQDVTTVNGKTYRKKIACFQDPRGTWKSTNGITATMYTVNHGADSWHVLFAWHRGRLALHAQRARRAAAHLLEGRREPEEDARRARARPPDDLMRLTRRQALAGTAGAIAGAAGIYALVDEHTSAPAASARALDAPARAAPARRRPGHHRQRRRGARAAAPPRGRDGDRRDRRPRRGAQAISRRRSRSSSRSTRRRRPGSGSRSRGGCRTSGQHVPAQWERLQPIDIRAQSPALLDAVRFSSDPRTPSSSRTTSRSSSAATASRRSQRPRRRSSTTSTCFEKTTVRRGFAGGGLPSKLAVAAGVPGADLIPPEAELFLGFTSTLRQNLGPSRIANLETLGLARIPQGYFTHGTHMHLSHIHENLEAWYVNTLPRRPGADDVPPRAPRARGDAHRAAGRRPGVDRRRGAPGLPGARRDRAQRRAADGLQARAANTSGRTGRSTRRVSRSRSAPTSTRSTTRSRGAPTARARPIRRPASTSSSSTRRATTSIACAGRWTAPCRTGRRSPSSRGPRARASTASSARPGARTSSCRRAPTARSRSPRSAPDRGPPRRLRSDPGRSGGTGRRTGLKIRRLKGRGGSIPPFGITLQGPRPLVARRHLRGVRAEPG